MTADPLYFPLPCPKCNAPNSLFGAVLCLVQPGPGLASYVYGRPTILHMPNESFVKCHACDWEGTAKEVRQ